MRGGFRDATGGKPVGIGRQFGGKVSGGGVDQIHQVGGAVAAVAIGEVLRGVEAFVSFLRRTPDHQAPTCRQGSNGLIQVGTEGLSGFLRGGEPFRAVEGAAGHGAVLRGDHHGAAAGEVFQQIHPPLGHLTIGRDNLPGAGQLLSQGPQHGGAAGGGAISEGCAASKD